MKRVLFLIVFILSVGAVWAQSGAGAYKGFWNGVLAVGGQNIKIEFEILEQQEEVLGKMNAQGVKGEAGGAAGDEVFRSEDGKQYYGYF